MDGTLYIVGKFYDLGKNNTISAKEEACLRQIFPPLVPCYSVLAGFTFTLIYISYFNNSNNKPYPIFLSCFL